MFLLVPAYPGCPGKTAVKWLLLLFSALSLLVGNEEEQLSNGNGNNVAYLASNSSNSRSSDVPHENSSASVADV